MKNILLGLFFLSYNLYSQVPEILWTYDVLDNSFGQTAMDDIDGDGKYEMVFGCYRNDSCIYALNAEDGTLLWKFNASGIAEGCNDTAPLIYDVDNDGLLDVIVASSCNPVTYCFDGATGNIKWQTNTRGSDSPPTVADLDNDGIYEILHGEFEGYVICINGMNGEVKWEILVDPNSAIQTAPTLIDLDNDGYLDFVVATWNAQGQNRMYAYKGSTQELLWSYDLNNIVYHGTALIDIDGDGIEELVFGDYSGRLHILNAADGTLIWNFDAPHYIGAPVSIGDLTGDGKCDIVFTSGNLYYALNTDGQILWQYTIPNFAYSFRGAALADLDSDGLLDVVFGTSGGLLVALKGLDGSIIWTMDLQAHFGNEFLIDHAPVIADFNNDGILDIFIVGGYSEYPDFYKNYGRAYAISVGVGSGPEWKMFQNNAHRTGSICGYTTNINETVFYNSKIKISPNPADEKILIKNIELNKKIEIYNTLGILIYNAIADNAEIEIALSKYPVGLYFIKIDEQFHKFVKISY